MPLFALISMVCATSVLATSVQDLTFPAENASLEGNAGTPLWLIGSVQEMRDNAAGMELFRADGPSFEQIRQAGFANELIDIEPWGRMYLRFEDCDTGTVSYSSPESGDGFFEIERLYRTESARCF